MKINANHPPVYAFKCNEFETLEFLSTRKLLKAFPALENDIRYTYYDIKTKARLRSIDFSFHSNFELDVQGKDHQVIIGGTVTGNYSLATYFLALSEMNDAKNLIRKFHFDYDISTGTKQPVPTFHLQYGGQMSTQTAALNVSDTKLDAWLSVPRLNFHPLNLALLLDLTFCEFNSDTTRKITQDPIWRGLIKKNEIFLVKSYYKSIWDFCSSDRYTSENLIRDYCYGS